MSNVYNLEPPTAGKVVLKTSHGDVEVELWPKEAPKAVRNFVQLCLEGYYDGSIFHRIIPGLAVQGGDPTGTGTGGDSIYDGPFKDEFHSRLRFSHRGLVACANPNVKDANGSQFFITLDKAEGLNKKHTIFGKVTGDTIYNVAAMGELEVDEDDRPIQPPLLKSVEVLWNPFPDIQPRITAEEKRRLKAEQEATKQKVQRGARPRKKNVQLLSFGEEAAEEEQVFASAPKVVSAHDAIDDDRLAKEHAQDLAAFATAAREPRPRSATASEQETAAAKDEKVEDNDTVQHEDALAARAALKRKRDDWPAVAHDVSRKDKLHAMSADGQQRRAQVGSGGANARHVGVHVAQVSNGNGVADGDDDDDNDDDSDAEQRDYTTERRSAVLNKSKARSAVVVPSKQLVVEDAELLTAWQRKRAEYKARKRLGGAREKDTMQKLKTFAAKLQQQAAGTAASQAAIMPPPRQQPVVTDPSAAKGSSQGAEDGYDGKVRGDLDHDMLKPPSWRVDAYLQEVEEGGDQLSLAELSQHKLKFVKIKDSNARRDDVNDYVVLDPLANQGKVFNRQDQAAKKKGTEWAGRAMA